MTALQDQLTGEVSRRLTGRVSRRLVAPTAMVLPAVAFLVIFVVIPAVVLLSYSVLTQTTTGQIDFPLTLNNYQRLFGSPTYRAIFYNTIFIATCATVIAMVVAYPLAMTVAFGSPQFSRITMALVVAPLVVNVVVRTYGWQLLLGNGPRGVLNYTLGIAGLPPIISILNTKWAVIIASVHVYLPLVVLPLAGSLSRIQPSLLEAAKTLGAPIWRAFLSVTLPLSAPGLIVGAAIVFTLTAGSYITPQMLGGRDGVVLGVLLEQQVNTVYDWPMSAAIAATMISVALVAHFLSHRLMGKRPVR